MLRLENTQNVSMWYGAQELLLNKISEVEETAATIDSIDVEDINRVARELVMKKIVNLAISTELDPLSTDQGLFLSGKL